jgi:hypothetical protein
MQRVATLYSSLVHKHIHFHRHVFTSRCLVKALTVGSPLTLRSRTFPLPSQQRLVTAERQQSCLYLGTDRVPLLQYNCCPGNTFFAELLLSNGCIVSYFAAVAWQRVYMEQYFFLNPYISRPQQRPIAHRGISIIFTSSVNFGSTSWNTKPRNAAGKSRDSVVFVVSAGRQSVNHLREVNFC